MKTLLIKKETGGALVGIIIILIILLGAGIYFYKATRKQATESDKSDEITEILTSPENTQSQ